MPSNLVAGAVDPNSGLQSCFEMPDAVVVIETPNDVFHNSSLFFPFIIFDIKATPSWNRRAEAAVHRTEGAKNRSS